MSDDLAHEQKETRRRQRKDLDAVVRDGSQSKSRLPAESQPSACGAPEVAGTKFKIQAKDITDLKYFDKLGPLLERMHDDACQRDKAGNRELHFDQYCLLILLYLFNPIVTSLRGIRYRPTNGRWGFLSRLPLLALSG